jgi:hypothetical protein
MNGLVKAVRRIQLKQISSAPNIFQAIITYEPLSSGSDDLKYQKQLMNDLVLHNWFMTDRGKRLLLAKKLWRTDIK